MKNARLKILIAFLLLSGLGVFLALNLYNKPLKDIKKSNADIIITAQHLLNDYSKDEDQANQKYVDNIIQVQGKISKVSIENGNSIITIMNDTQESSILCHMLPEENMSVLKLKKEDKIIVKGVCTGYLLDVIMVRCVLAN